MRPLAVFDIDGTLVDSRASIHRAATEAAQALGLPEPSYDRVRRIVGLSLHEALRTLEPGLTDAELADFVAAFQASFRRMYDAGHEEPLYEGSAELLRRLHRDGWRLALATGQSRKGLERNLARAGWSDMFISAHCAEDGPGKPHPAMLLAAMKACAATPETTVMIGDTGHDMRMARAAEAVGLGVAWGFHTAGEMLAEGARHVATDFDDLAETLGGLTP
ncbi:MAG: HAD-IA family hydrolase [Brevundimonas sp.]